jgi:hypothetical protein
MTWLPGGRSMVGFVVLLDSIEKPLLNTDLVAHFRWDDYTTPPNTVGKVFLSSWIVVYIKSLQSVHVECV